VQIPDVTGQPASSARAALLQATLTVRTTYRRGRAGVVLTQTPTGSAPAYTQVTIAVGR
jgi:beta-lactam-binding protein with PASTA domain